MIYTYDCEFNEDGKTIDLFSIAFVREDGKELYLFNKDFNILKAWRENPWLIANVFKPVWDSYFYTAIRRVPTLDVPKFNYLNFRNWFKSEAVSYKVIKDHITKFTAKDPKVELWGYYADYDHVVLSQIFGTMMNLPKNFPMYTKDLKQEADRLGLDLSKLIPQENEHDALADARWNMKAYRLIQDRN